MKAIALISGGLDSVLAARFMRDLGIELVALNTLSPFCLCNHRSANGCFHGVSVVAKELEIKLVSINVAEEFLEIVKSPKHGYGSNMNPCIDCRILLFKKAKELMREEGASFVITGEVLGQRPMSQMRRTMLLIEKEAGLDGLVLRPLSAKVLEPTLAEKQGWVPREKMLAINGRGRKEQFSLAAKLGVKDFPCPSGGCLLTDPEFSKRLKDLMAHGEFTLDDVLLLKLGRHFRLTPQTKLIVGRNESENNNLVSISKGNDYLFYPNEELAGPTSLARGLIDENLIELISRITCRYSDLKEKKSARIFYRKIPETKEQAVVTLPIEEEKLCQLRV